MSHWNVAVWGESEGDLSRMCRNIPLSIQVLSSLKAPRLSLEQVGRVRRGRGCVSPTPTYSTTSKQCWVLQRKRCRYCRAYSDWVTWARRGQCPTLSHLQSAEKPECHYLLLLMPHSTVLVEGELKSTKIVELYSLFIDFCNHCTAKVIVQKCTWTLHAARKCPSRRRCNFWRTPCKLLYLGCMGTVPLEKQWIVMNIKTIFPRYETFLLSKLHKIYT